MARTLLSYGESGTYKTSNIGQVADYLAETTGGVTRLITADSGTGPVEDQIQRGVIEPWVLTSASAPLPCLMYGVQGYWPTKIDPRNFKADESSLRKTTVDEWKDVACIAIEGLGMIGSLLYDDLVTKGRQTGEPLQGQFTEGVSNDLKMNFGMGSRGTYNFIQQKTEAYVRLLKALPCPWAYVTTHESKGEDTQKRTVFGPSILGKAATDKVASWFCCTLHHESYMVNSEVKTAKGNINVTRPGIRAYFIRHPDPETPNIYWPAKLDLEPKTNARVMNKWPHGYIPMTLDGKGEYVSGVHSLLKEIDAVREERLAALKQGS